MRGSTLFPRKGGLGQAGQATHIKQFPLCTEQGPPHMSRTSKWESGHTWVMADSKCVVADAAQNRAWGLGMAGRQGYVGRR